MVQEPQRPPAQQREMLSPLTSARSLVDAFNAERAGVIDRGELYRPPVDEDLSRTGW
jgi:hypothetical protein